MANESTDAIYNSYHTGQEIDAAVDAITAHTADEDRHVTAELKEKYDGYEVEIENLKQSQGISELVFSKLAEFPEPGNPNKLYVDVDENIVYRFDEIQNVYKKLGSVPGLATAESDGLMSAADKSKLDAFSGIEYGTEELESGVSPLESGKLYLVYE